MSLPESGVAHQIKVRFGESLKAARRSLGLTQEQVGKLSGRGRIYVQRVESARTNPTIEAMVSLAVAVSSTVEALLQPERALSIEPVTDVTIGAKMETQSGELAIELPAGAAFEAGRILATHLGRSVPLIDPQTRIVSGIAGVASDITIGTPPPEK